MSGRRDGLTVAMASELHEQLDAAARAAGQAAERAAFGVTLEALQEYIPAEPADAGQGFGQPEPRLRLDAQRFASLWMRRYARGGRSYPQWCADCQAAWLIYAEAPRKKRRAMESQLGARSAG
jgi:hypothetical protein